MFYFMTKESPLGCRGYSNSSLPYRLNVNANRGHESVNRGFESVVAAWRMYGSCDMVLVEVG
jgi:hypothetical protein